MNEDAQDLAERVDSLERSHIEMVEAQKESEVSVIKSIKTLLQDLSRYNDGEGDFPTSAMLGALYAYLRPRLLIVVTGIGALFVGAIQVWILLNQNSLLETQNDLFELQNEQISNQSKSASLAAMSSVLSTAQQEGNTDLAVAQLVSFGDQGFDVLLNLVRYKVNEWDVAAARMLVDTAQEHSQDMALVTLEALWESKIKYLSQLAQLIEHHFDDERFIKNFEKSDDPRFIERVKEKRDHILRMSDESSGIKDSLVKMQNLLDEYNKKTWQLHEPITHKTEAVKSKITNLILLTHYFNSVQDVPENHPARFAQEFTKNSIIPNFCGLDFHETVSDLSLDLRIENARASRWLDVIKLQQLIDEQCRFVVFSEDRSKSYD